MFAIDSCICLTSCIILILKTRKLKSVGGGSIDIQLRKVVGGEGGEGRGVIDRRSTWKGSTKTLQGLPLAMLILGWG